MQRWNARRTRASACLRWPCPTPWRACSWPSNCTAPGPSRRGIHIIGL